MKKEHFLQSEGFKTVAASVLSILIGLAVGSIVILIVGLTSPNLSLSSAWDGIRIVFGGLFSTGRDASGTLTWGFNPTNIGNMLFRAAPLIMTGLSVGMAYKTGLFNIGAPGQYLIGTLVSLSIALGLPSETMSTTLIWLLAFLGGTLAGMGGFVYALTTANCASNGDVAGFGFLALAVMIFGNWKPVNIAVSSLLFGLFKCIAASYASIDINGDGVFMLAEIGISAHLYRMLPYIVTLLVLAFTSKSSRAPKAEGIPYDKGQR